ncbi:MAG: hypothetical protein K0Q72_845, partial [Armatimonadetes bacterium]|nr:hypothetical protein [Armatimonadota bacterium]
PLAVLLSQNRTSGADGPFDLSSDSLDVIELMMAFEADAELFAGMPDVNLKTWKHLLATFTVQELADFIDGR